VRVSGPDAVGISLDEGIWVDAVGISLDEGIWVDAVSISLDEGFRTGPSGHLSR
jgi:hypothetical protein